jgi:hypothetical protein
MTSADLDHNDKLLAAGKKEKLEWVTPKISLMGAGETFGRESRFRYTANLTSNSQGPS